MENGSIGRRAAVGVALWSLLSLGVSVVLFVLFSVTGAVPVGDASLPAVTLALGILVTGLAFLVVVVDRLLFTREPTGILTRQSVWVLALAISVVIVTGVSLHTVAATPGNAVLIGIVVGLPTTMLLFAAINIARYRSMEHEP